MTVKTRGIRLKKRLSLEDQGQLKLMQVTYSQTAANRSATTNGPGVGHPPTPARPRPSAATAKHRAVARMLRIELEATLAFLDQALDDMSGNDPLTGNGRLGK